MLIENAIQKCLSCKKMFIPIAYNLEGYDKWQIHIKNVIFNKTTTTLSTILKKCFFFTKSEPYKLL